MPDARFLELVATHRDLGLDHIDLAEEASIVFIGKQAIAEELVEELAGRRQVVRFAAAAGDSSTNRSLKTRSRMFSRSS